MQKKCLILLHSSSIVTPSVKQIMPCPYLHIYVSYKRHRITFFVLKNHYEHLKRNFSMILTVFEIWIKIHEFPNQSLVLFLLSFFRKKSLKRLWNGSLETSFLQPFQIKSQNQQENIDLFIIWNIDANIWCDITFPIQFRNFLKKEISQSFSRLLW